MTIEKQAMDWAKDHGIKLTKKDLERLHELASKPHARILVDDVTCEVQVAKDAVTDRLVLHAPSGRCLQLQDFAAF